MSKRRRITQKQLQEQSFAKLYKFLFTDEFIKLSSDAKILYTLLRDRYELSSSNGWINENGEVFLIYTREEMCEMLQCSEPTIRKAIKQLKEYNLIEEQRQGLNKPNLIYVLDIDLEASKINGTKKLYGQECKNVSCNDTKNINDTENNLHHLEELNDEYAFTYLDIMNQYGYKHKGITTDNFNYIRDSIEAIKDYDISLEEWQEEVRDHFKEVKKNGKGDGDILRFLKASYRHFNLEV